MTDPTETGDEFPEITDWRDAVEQACDAFEPTSGKTDAGPHVYTRFTDVDGSEVTVSLSSAAMRECARVFANPAEYLARGAVAPGGMVHPPWKPTGLHLCRCMAAELRRALDAAFEGTLDVRSRCAERAHVREVVDQP